jgi:hypothetical protein
MYIVGTLPVVTELQRTFGTAMKNQKLDFKYYEKKAADRYKQFQSTAEKTAQ